MKHVLHLGLLLVLIGLFADKLGPRFGWFPAPHELVLAEGDRGEIDAKTVLYLEHFNILRYPSGKPRQYVSEVKVIDENAHTLSAASISVNHPLRIKGWWVYQFGFGPDQTNTMCTQLRCVRDPSLPVSALGGLLLVLGSIGLCFRRRREDALLPRPTVVRRILGFVLGGIAVVLPIFIITRAVLRPEPVPALQSVLMAPHVAAYAASYLILLFAAFGIGRRAVPIGFALMTIGLVVGATWGKIAWSDWWQFDPKENWSFVTWCAYAAYFHCRVGSRLSTWLLRLGAVLIVITLTWVNFSHRFSGLHSYAAFGGCKPSCAELRLV